MSKTKTELLTEMRELQNSYAKVAGEYKELVAKEEVDNFNARQMERLELYKTKYKFYAMNNGEAKPIDWEEVEKLVKSTPGYALGFDQTGMEGLAYDYGNGSTFSPMVEEEADVRKYLEREKLRSEFAERVKNNKRV